MQLQDVLTADMVYEPVAQVFLSVHLLALMIHLPAGNKEIEARFVPREGFCRQRGPRLGATSPSVVETKPSAGSKWA